MLDYNSFTLNLEPSDVNNTMVAIDDLVHDRKRLGQMQRSLVQAQRWLDWDAEETEPGIARLLLHELETRAIKARKMRIRTFRP